MRKRLGGCLWFLGGLCGGLIWILADILTKNPVNKLTPFNVAVLIILIGGSQVFIRCQTRKREKAALAQGTVHKWAGEETQAARRKGGSISRRRPKKG